MKKLLSMLLALAMMLTAVAAFADGVDVNTLPDTMTSEDGTYAVAMVTDVGQLKDKSFNEGTWNGVKGYAAANGLSYKYYQPANGDQATDEDRYDAMKQACENGAKVVVGPGFMQAGAMARAAADYPEVKFVFIDGFPLTDADGNVLANVAPVAFSEEQAGYFAGYAIVAEGFTRLGFTGGGGGTNPACMRYGYGFIQGANDAAKAKGLNKEDVEIKYTWAYGASFSPSAELQTMVSGWYETGTEIVFSCGGSIFSSVTAAASANDGFVCGVDVDQSYESDTVIISALKGITAATEWAAAKAFDGTWEEIGGTPVSLGVANEAVGLPVDTWSFENYTVAEYEQLFADVLAGNVTISADAPEGNPGNDFSNLTVDYVE